MSDFSIWDSYRQGQDAALRPQAAQIQNAHGLMGILAQQQALQQHVAASQREGQFRSELQSLGPNATQESLAGVAAKYAPAADVLKSQTSSLDRKASIDATKQMALSRLMQTAQRDLATIDYREKNAKTAEEKFHWQQQLDQVKAAATVQAAEINAGKYAADYGATIQPFQAPVPTPGAAVKLAPTITVADIMGMPEKDRAAAIASLQNQPMVQPSGLQPAAFQPPQNAAPIAAPAITPAVTAPVGIPPNGDMRDIMALRGKYGTPVPAPTPPQPGPIPTAAITETPAPASPPVTTPRPTLADAPPELLPKEKRKWLADATRASVAGAGRLTPEALTLVADQYLSGDSKAITGYARDQATKSALTNEIAKRAMQQGIDGKLLAAIMGEYQGFVSGQRVLGTREAQLSVAADVTSKFVPIAIDASEKFDRTGWKSINDIQIAVNNNTASPELRRFAAANNALINVYARAINPSGASTVSDKEHAREILSTAFSKGDYRAGAEQLKTEVDTELKSPGSVKADMRQRFTGANDRRAISGKVIDFNSLSK